jgi:hypothetical protein
MTEFLSISKSFDIQIFYRFRFGGEYTVVTVFADA